MKWFDELSVHEKYDLNYLKKQKYNIIMIW